jgi:hypothetical protein
VINRQALTLLSGLVRVIGYEVAGIYGSGFRHRDANWIYAAELTELVCEFSLSRDSLAHALREIGALELRSEYDRIFLYRCLANRKSASPQRYSASTVLTMDERRAVATRLERFLEAFVHGKTASRVDHWKTATERRLGIKLSVALKTTSGSVRDQIVDAVRSLASFLVSIKQLEPPEAVGLLENCGLLRELPVEERSPLLKSLAENASFFFEHPDLDPDGDLPDKYLEDLASLNARTAPHATGIEDTLDDVAAYLRRPPKKMRSLVERLSAAALMARLPPDTPQKRFSPAAVRAALDLLTDTDEQARFFYGPAKLEWADERQPAGSSEPLWLLGTSRRMQLVSAGDQPRVVWQAERGQVRAEPIRQLLATSCRLTGGQWQIAAGPRPVAIRLNAGLAASFGAYFRPLLEVISTARVPLPADGAQGVRAT